MFLEFFLRPFFAVKAHALHFVTAVFLDRYPDEQVVTAVGMVHKVHRGHGDVVHTAKVALIPRVDMSPERDGRVPIGQFVQDVIQFLAAVGRCELVERWAEDIGVGEGKGVADFLVVALEETILDLINLITAKRAISRVQEDESVIGSIIITDYSDSEFIE